MWLGTAVLSVYEIGLIRNIVLSICAWLMVLSGRNLQVRATFQGSAVSQIFTILMAIVAIITINGGFEYIHKRVGQAAVLKMLAWILGVQVFILALRLIL